MKTIIATFSQRYRFKGDLEDMDTGRYFYKFSTVRDPKGKRLPDCEFRENQLLDKAKLKIGTEYKIEIDKINVAVSVAWGTGNNKVYKKNGNSIWRIDEDGNETNLSLDSPAQYFRRLLNEQAAANKKKSK